MKTTKLFVLLVLLLSTAYPSFAQTPKDALLQDWERAKAYTKEYLDAMPDEQYGFKPTPEMRSFADQMLHLTDDNFLFAAVATGIKNPNEGSLEKTTDKSKATVTQEVLTGYDFVISSIKQLSLEQLAEQIKLFGKFDATRSQTLAKGFEHQTHHRGQTTVYLRLAGVTPPQEKLF